MVKAKRHWSFIVCDKKYIYPVVLMLLGLGIWGAIHFDDPTQFSRTGNFIIGVGVWISMRSTFREGLNKYKNAQDTQPVINSNQLNPSYINNITFSLGDAQLQIHGFVLVILGSIIGSYGDITKTKP